MRREMFDQEHAATTKEKTRQPYAVAGFSKETDVWLSLYGGALRVVRKPKFALLLFRLSTRDRFHFSDSRKTSRAGSFGDIKT